MSRKHYQEAAKVIHESGIMGIDVKAFTLLVDGLASMFKSDNSAFDRERFVEACETGQ